GGKPYIGIGTVTVPCDDEVIKTALRGPDRRHEPALKVGQGPVKLARLLTVNTITSQNHPPAHPENALYPSSCPCPHRLAAPALSPWPVPDPGSCGTRATPPSPSLVAPSASACAS